MRIDVYGLGQCSLDHLAVLPGYPKPDTKCEFREMVVQGGGPAAMAMVALSRWGISCAFAGVVGDYSFGAEIKRTLDVEGGRPWHVLCVCDSAWRRGL